MGFLMPKAPAVNMAAPNISVPPVPPAANPPTLASSSSQMGEAAQARAAAAAQGGYDQTILTGPMGVPNPSTATKTLTGQ